MASHMLKIFVRSVGPVVLGLFMVTESARGEGFVATATRVAQLVDTVGVFQSLGGGAHIGRFSIGGEFGFGARQPIDGYTVQFITAGVTAEVDIVETEAWRTTLGGQLGGGGVDAASNSETNHYTYPEGQFFHMDVAGSWILKLQGKVFRWMSPSAHLGFRSIKHSGVAELAHNYSGAFIGMGLRANLPPRTP